MRSGIKMLAATSARRGERADSNRMERSDPHSNYDDSRMGYAGMGGEMAYGRMGGMDYGESRFRDRRGREHYDNGRFAPMRGAMDDWEEMDDNYGAESRRYRRYSNGRFAPRSAYEGGSGGGEMHYPSPFVPPIYERDGERGVNPIGFVPQGYWDMESNYGMYADHKPMDEMEHRSSHMQRGGASGGSGKMDKAMAEEWVRSMKNEDGSRGPHWNIDQAQQAMKTRGVQAEPWEFWAVMNMMYSDYCKVFKTHNLNTMDVYADMAAAWINDKDAGPEKTAKYFQFVVS